MVELTITGNRYKLVPDSPQLTDSADSPLLVRLAANSLKTQLDSAQHREKSLVEKSLYANIFSLTALRGKTNVEEVINPSHGSHALFHDSSLLMLSAAEC